MKPGTPHQVAATASVTPMAVPAAPKSPARLDLIGKRVLRALADHVDVDAAAVARSVGASEEVVRARLRTMREAGLVQGFRLRVDARQLGPSFEFLVTGAPSERTDRGALDALCADPQVTRAFGLASAHSVAFTVVGRDLAATRAHGLALAGRAGLRQPQAAMVVATFRDEAGGPAPVLLGDAPVPVAQAAPAAPPVAPAVPAVSLLELAPAAPGPEAEAIAS